MPEPEVLKVARPTGPSSVLPRGSEHVESDSGRLCSRERIRPLFLKIESLEHQSMLFDCVSCFMEGRKEIGAALKWIHVTGTVKVADYRL